MDKRTEQKVFLYFLVSDCRNGEEDGWVDVIMPYAMAIQKRAVCRLGRYVAKKHIRVDLSKILSITQVFTKMEAKYDYGRAIIDWQKANFPDSVYGHSRPLVIEKCFTKHDD
jgi:hypothetical protein